MGGQGFAGDHVDAAAAESQKALAIEGNSLPRTARLDQPRG